MATSTDSPVMLTLRSLPVMTQWQLMFFCALHGNDKMVQISPMQRASPIAICAVMLGVLAATPSLVLCENNQQACEPGPDCLVEEFDEVTPPALPTGWVATNIINPDGIFWVTSNSGDPSPPADSPPNATFINDPGGISDKRLDSPFVLKCQGTGCMWVMFRNNFNLDDGLDGGVLEVSFDFGANFADVLAVGGSFEQGGYNGVISNCCGNPLAGRQAWTGNSGGFITTIVNVPVALNGVVLRWRMGSDISGAGEGWRIDSVIIEEPHKQTPAPPTPTLTPTPTVTPSPTPRPAPTPRPRPTPARRPLPG
jgi:hypothetical protein